MKNILAHKKRDADVSIEARAINPAGFEAHKKTLTDLADTDLVDRVESVGSDWPVYVVFKITDKASPVQEQDGDKDAENVEDDPPSPPMKVKKTTATGEASSSVDSEKKVKKVKKEANTGGKAAA